MREVEKYTSRTEVELAPHQSDLLCAQPRRTVPKYPLTHRRYLDPASIPPSIRPAS